MGPLFFALVLASALLMPAAAAGEEEEKAAEARGDVLVIYPEEADRRSSDDSMAGVAQVLLSLGYAADYVEAREAGPLLEDYDRLIWCGVAASERLEPELLRDYPGSMLILGRAEGLEGLGIEPAQGAENVLAGTARYSFSGEETFEASVPLRIPGKLKGAEYAAGLLESDGEAVPLVSARGRIRYIPLIDYTANFAKAVLMQEMFLWLWPYSSRPPIYTEYVVLDGVYPFTDPYRLRDIVDTLVEEKMTFVISVMPIYRNADYPAMQQFCEVLRYAQASGGSVILHAPIVQNGVEAEELASQLTLATCSYLDNDVYPLALEIPSEWLFQPELREVLSRYRTLFLSDMDAFRAHSVGEYSLKEFLAIGSQRILPVLKLEETGISQLSCCPTAIYLDLNALTDEEMRLTFDAAGDAPIPMQSLWEMEESVYLNEGNYLTWDRSSLIVNGVQRFNVYEPKEFDGNHDYKRDIYYRFVANLKNQNRLLIGLSAVVLFLFLLLAVQSRKQMHRRFLKRREHTGKRDRG